MTNFLLSRILKTSKTAVAGTSVCLWAQAVLGYGTSTRTNGTKDLVRRGAFAGKLPLPSQWTWRNPIGPCGCRPRLSPHQWSRMGAFHSLFGARNSFGGRIRTLVRELETTARWTNVGVPPTPLVHDAIELSIACA